MKKRVLLISLLISVLLIFSSLCITTYAEDNLSGDINGDSIVDINDAIYLLRHTMMPSRYPVSQSGDIDGTGNVSIEDAIYLLRHTMMPSRYPIMDEVHVHSFTQHSSVEPTCENQGNIEYWHCTSCNKYYSDAEGNNEISLEDTVLDSLGHSFGDWHEITVPTCTVDGLERRDCSKCEHYETNTLGSKGHNYTGVVTTPTCTEQGYTTHNCYCGDSYVDSYVDALGHNYGDWYEVTSPTCTVDGLERRDCTRCEHYETNVLNKLGHSHNAVVTAPTCTERGYTTHTCHCGDSYVSNETEALGHSYTSKVTTAPTYTTTGIRTYTCSACGDSYTEVIPAIACEHNYTSVVTAPTCTAQGYTTYTCLECGDSYIDNYTPKIEHSWGDGVVTTAPTCTVDGVRTFTCSCGETKTKVEPATGHSYTSVVTAPTCTERGYTTHTCHCGDSYIDTYVNALGHEYGEWYKISASTCTENGQEKHECEKCNYYEHRVTEPTGHSYINDNCNNCGIVKTDSWVLEDGEFKILMIGNSYTQDASNVAQPDKQSQMFSILQSMLGKDVKITLGIIISGGKGIHWHATKAEENSVSYTLQVISSDNPQWVNVKRVTSAEALEWTNWDIVSLQPYNINVTTGMESVPYPNETAEKFYHSADAAAYLLDHVYKYAPQSDVYCYMHWAQTSATVLNANLSQYNKMANFYPSVLEYRGTQYGKTFKSLVPVGLSIQNARTTYLALLSYNTTAYADGTLNYTTDAQIGLQRDGGHVSFNIGRYIAALTFAEMIIPESIRAEEYELPDIRKTESVGVLPKEYTDIAQKSVFAAINSWKNGSLAVTNIDGYEKDPTDIFAEKFADGITLSCNTEITYIFNKVEEIIYANAFNGIVIEEITLPEDITQGEAFSVTVKVCFGYTILEFEINVVLAHELETVEAVAPTCTETGLTEGIHCSVCNEVLVAQEIIPMEEHDEMVISAIEPSCWFTGLTEGKRCSTCGEVLKEQEVIPKTSHSFGDWEVYWNPNSQCQEERRYCSNCSYCESREIPEPDDEHEHEYIVVAERSPSCIEQGYISYLCNNCGHWYTEYLDPTGQHIFGEWVLWERSTTTTEGLEKRTCVCGLTEERAIEKNKYSELTYTLNPDGQSYSVTNRSLGCRDTHIIIPPEYNGLPVTAIADHAFQEGSTIWGMVVTHIDIPDTVTSIGIYAFSSFDGLESINIPNSVKYIGEYAFMECSSLKSVKIPSGIESIADFAFYLCSSLTSVDIPDSVSSIGNWSFYECVSLENIDIPTSVVNIGEYAFAKCSSMMDLTIPDSVEIVAQNAFEDCYKLTNVKIGNKLESISYRMFANCNSLSNVIIGDSVTDIETLAFLSCSSLATISIPNNVTRIGGDAFRNCISLESINIPNDVLELGGNVFRDCSSLKKVILGSGINHIQWGTFNNCTALESVDVSNCVTSISDYAFYCESLTNINFDGSIEQWNNINKSSYWDYNAGDYKIYCTDGVICKTHTEAITPAVAPICTETGLTEGEHCSFCGKILVAQMVVDALGHSESDWIVDIEATKTEDGLRHTECTMCGKTMQEQTVGAGSQGLEYTLNGDGVSYSVTGLGICTDSDMVIPSKYNSLPVTSIGSYVFSGCTSLTSVTISDSITSIGEGAFQGCKSLATVTIGCSVTNIGNSAFRNCFSINTIYFNAIDMSDLAYQNGVFFNAGATSSGIEVIVGPEVTKIPTCLFFPCVVYGSSEHKITSVTFAEGSHCESIGDHAFHDCQLSSIQIPDSVKTIGHSALAVNEELTTVVIGNNVTSIGGSAFYYCLSLSEINFNGSVADWFAIDKPSTWDETTIMYNIYCTDGTIAKDGTVTYN